MSRTFDVIVVGGGFAGLSAAVRAATRGARVLVVEARPRLGGRATAFPDRETGELVDNGQHVLLGCYRSTLAFLADIGALERVRVQPQLAVTTIDLAGVRTRLVCPPLPAPLHLLAGIIDWDGIGCRDKLAALRMATPLRLAQREARGEAVAAASPGETVDAWLVRNGQTARLRDMLWHPLALAALNQPADVAAAPVFARVLAEMFAPKAATGPEPAAIVLPATSLNQMYAEPAQAFLAARGSETRTGAAARLIIEDGRAVGVDLNGARILAGAVIAAVPWFAFSALVDPVPAALAPTVSNARLMAASPIVSVNLWLDRPVLDDAFVGLPGRTMQWVFDAGITTGGRASHLSLVSSGAESLLARTNQALVALAHEELVGALPAAGAARLLRAAVVREPRATFSLAPGQPPRPSAATLIDGLFLAGDWTDTGLPATIESAVRSGYRAADLASAAHGQFG
ncbi:MAG: hydroxysqualene dehydroxylase HpnE [Acidobacteriota bacterium]